MMMDEVKQRMNIEGWSKTRDEYWMSINWLSKVKDNKKKMRFRIKAWYWKKISPIFFNTNECFLAQCKPYHLKVNIVCEYEVNLSNNGKVIIKKQYFNTNC